MDYDIADHSILLLTFEGKLFGQQVMTNLCYRLDNDPPGEITGAKARLDDLLATVIGVGGLYTKWLNAISRSVKSCEAYGQIISPVRYAYRDALDAADEGLIASDALAPNYSAVVVRSGVLADRHNNSVLKLPGVPSNGIIDGVVQAGYGVALDEFAQASIEALPFGFGTQAFPVAFNRATPANSRDLDLAYAQPTARVMRRRTVGVGS